MGRLIAAAALLGAALWPAVAAAQKPIELPPLIADQAPAPAMPRGQVRFPGPTIPIWQGKAVTDGQTYNYAMVGKDPTVAQADPTSTVKVILLPVILHFTQQGLVADPTAIDTACRPEGSALSLTLQSPLFQDIRMVVSGTDIGTGQYLQLFQRANFWKFTNPQGINPGYSVILKPEIVPLQIGVRGGAVVADTCGQLGLISFDAWDNYVQNVLYAKLPSLLAPTVFPVFLFYGACLYSGDISNRCGGDHLAYLSESSPPPVFVFRTYAYATFSRQIDIAELTHEMGEWMDDAPCALGVTCGTPPHGNIGSISGCTTQLEIGDPLDSDPTFPVHMANGFTYHVEDLAFLSWFYRQQPSIGANGFYSLFGTLRTPALPCG